MANEFQPNHISATIATMRPSSSSLRTGRERPPRMEGPKMCILLVEDEFLIRAMLADELRLNGLDVREAANADEAVHILASIDPPLQILVTDIHMPGRQNGIALAEYVREHLPTVPVIFTTGRPDVLAGTGIPHENEAVFSKPYSFRDLITRIRELMAVG